jgi:hypothetical protein
MANRPEKFEGEGGYCSKTVIYKSMFMFSGNSEFGFLKLFSGKISFSSCKFCVYS